MADGETLIVEVLAFPGDHKKVPPLTEELAESVAEVPEHIEGELTESVGTAFTETMDTAVPEHPLLVPVTV